MIDREHELASENSAAAGFFRSASPRSFIGQPDDPARSGLASNGVSARSHELSAWPQNSASLTPDVAAGLELLARSPPAWPIDAEPWSTFLSRARAFAERWDAPARAAQWTGLELYGVNPRAPLARYDAIGAGWLIARGRSVALSVDAAAFTVATRGGNRLKIYRTMPPSGAVLPWTIGQWMQPLQSAQMSSPATS
jgi:hypothetical protein